MKTIEFCFFRHGIAVDPADPSVASDPSGQSRPLTDEGILKTRAGAEGLKRMAIAFDKLLTSPWLRAKQTADILAEVLDLTPEELPELAGDHSPEELIKALAAHHGRRTLLVGHEPLLSATVAALLGADFDIDFKKSGACTLELEALPFKNPGTLLWLLTPKQLRWIGKS